MIKKYLEYGIGQFIIGITDIKNILIIMLLLAHLLVSGALCYITYQAAMGKQFEQGRNITLTDIYRDKNIKRK